MVVNGKNIVDYDHPFNVTIINDNSVIPDFKSAVPERVNFLSVFIGGKGRDNKLIKITSKADFVNEFGKPDILKYGQPILNAYASIVDQYSHSYCMRVMPLDACYSNIMILAKYKVTDGEMQVKLVSKSVASLNNAAQFQSMVEQEQKNEDDEAGFKTMPLFAVRSLGRGKYGNSYRIRLTNVFYRRKTQAYRTYRLEILDVDEGNVVVESFDGCLYDQAVNSRSLILSDIVDGDNTYSTRVGLYVNEDAFEVLYNEYKTLFTDEEVPVKDYKMFDPIFAINNNKTAIP